MAEAITGILLCCYSLVENFVNMRVKESHTDIFVFLFLFLILQLMLNYLMCIDQYQYS